MILSIADLVALAQSVGMAQPDIAAAIAMAESGGNTDAVGDLSLAPQGSVGLWQVFTKAHPDYDVASLHDPNYNARAAYAISSGGQNWAPWSTYTSGAYQRYLPAAQAALGSGGGHVPASPTQPVGGSSRLGGLPWRSPLALGVIGAAVGGPIGLSVGLAVGAFAGYFVPRLAPAATPGAVASRVKSAASDARYVAASAAQQAKARLRP